MLPRKGSRAMPTAHSLPTLTDLGPRLRPIHEIILVHHLRVSLVSRGCVPWITLTAVCRPTGYESRIHFRDATTCESFRNRSLCNTVAIKALYHFFNCIVHFYLSYYFRNPIVCYFYKSFESNPSNVNSNILEFNEIYYQRVLST